MSLNALLSLRKARRVLWGQTFLPLLEHEETEASGQLFRNAKEQEDQKFGALNIIFSEIKSPTMRLGRTQDESVQNRYPGLRMLD